MPRTGRPPKKDWAICLVPDCDHSVKNGAKGFCSTHYHQMRNGLIDENGNETGKRVRLHQKGTPCLIDGCSSLAVGQGLCSKHYQQKRHRTRVGDPPPKNNCRVCGGKHFARGFCQTHYAQWQRGIIDEEGNLLRPLKKIHRLTPGSICRQPGCDSPVRSKGWCNKHYIQYRSGILDEEGNQLRELMPNGRRPLDFRKEVAGYILVRAPKDHPYARQDGSILEHRWVMEQQIDEYLDPDEFLVHHKNGIRDDNDPCNLEVKPYRAHGPGKDADVETVHRTLLALKYNDPAACRSLIKEFQDN